MKKLEIIMINIGKVIFGTIFILSILAIPVLIIANFWELDGVIMLKLFKTNVVLAIASGICLVTLMQEK